MVWLQCIAEAISGDGLTIDGTLNDHEMVTAIKYTYYFPSVCHSEGRKHTEKHLRLPAQLSSSILTDYQTFVELFS